MAAPNPQGNTPYGWTTSYTMSHPTTAAYAVNTNSYTAPSYTAGTINQPEESSEDESEDDQPASNAYSQQVPAAMYHTTNYNYPYAHPAAYGYNTWQTPSGNVVSNAPAQSSHASAPTPGYPISYTTASPQTPSYATSVSVQYPRNQPQQEASRGHLATPAESGSDTKSVRRPHNRVERRYRQNINDQLEQLRQAVPALAYDHRNNQENTQRPSKGQILSGAIDYIHDLEEDCANLTAQLNNIRR